MTQNTKTLGVLDAWYLFYLIVEWRTTNVWWVLVPGRGFRRTRWWGAGRGVEARAEGRLGLGVFPLYSWNRKTSAILRNSPASGEYVRWLSGGLDRANGCLAQPNSGYSVFGVNDSCPWPRAFGGFYSTSSNEEIMSYTRGDCLDCSFFERCANGLILLCTRTRFYYIFPETLLDLETPLHYTLSLHRKMHWRSKHLQKDTALGYIFLSTHFFMWNMTR